MIGCRSADNTQQVEILKSLRSRLEALEQAARLVSGGRQLEIWMAALYGEYSSHN